MRTLLVDGLTGWQAGYKLCDNAILPTEWLGYGVECVPRLYEEMRDGSMRGTFDPRELADGKTQQVGALRFCVVASRSRAGAAAGTRIGARAVFADIDDSGCTIQARRSELQSECAEQPKGVSYAQGTNHLAD